MFTEYFDYPLGQILSDNLHIQYTSISCCSLNFSTLVLIFSLILKSNSHLIRLGIEGILYIALSYHTYVSDDFDCCAPQHVVLFVGESLAGSNNNGLAGVDA